MKKKIYLTSNLKHLRNKSGIYMFKFPNEKVYIGQSVDIYNRLNSHIWTVNSGNFKSQNKLYNAIVKYGLKNIEVIILWSTNRVIKDEHITKQEMDKLEVQYINEYKSMTEGYNATSGGQSLSRYINLSDEQRESNRKRIKERWEKISTSEKIDLIYEYGLEKASELLNLTVEELEQSITYTEYDKSLTSFTKTNTNNLNKSIENPEALKLAGENYEYLRKLLVKDDDTEDLFHETILYITYNYDPEVDFCTQFVNKFRSRRKTFLSDKKFVDINITDIDSYYTLSTEY